MIKLNGYEIKPTIFPDKTSQVWKIPDDTIKLDVHHIHWDFEHEAEIVHLLQLAELCKAHLYISYLPYARQDKPVSNTSTFALKTFIKLIETGDFCSVTVLDPHSEALLPFHWIKSRPEKQIRKLIKRLEAKVCYPDAGAACRYDIGPQPHVPVCADKIRDQLTGEILGMTLDHEKVSGSFLIVDDICDGGRTFTEVANLLYKAGASDVYLFTTHGLYTKGTEVLKEAGILKLFNMNGGKLNEI